MRFHKELTSKLLILVAFILGIFITNIATYIYVAYAHGGSTNLVHACVRNTFPNTPNIRIIPAGSTCNSNETPLDWNALGLAGTGAYIADFGGEDLSGFDFRLRDFQDRNFSEAVLESTNFERANLNNASFANTSLDNTILNKAELAGINMSGTSFNGTRINNADIQNKNWSVAAVINADFVESNLSGGTFVGSPNPINGNFSRANLTNVNFSSTTLGGDFTEANMTNTNFSGANVIGNFQYADLSTAIFNTATIFYGSNMAYANFTGQNLSSMDFTNVSTYTANFTNANLSGAHFTQNNVIGATWSNTICPDGTNSNNNPGGSCYDNIIIP